MTLMYIFPSGAWVPAEPAPMRSPCIYLFFVSFRFVFFCLSFFSQVYRGSWRMYVGPIIAQHNGIELYY